MLYIWIYTDILLAILLGKDMKYNKKAFKNKLHKSIIILLINSEITTAFALL